MKFSILIPARNEEKGIVTTVAEIIQAMTKKGNSHKGCPDGSRGSPYDFRFGIEIFSL